MTDIEIKILEDIKSQRQDEIVQEKNAGTSYPIYIVYEEITHVTEGSNYRQSTSLFGNSDETAIAKDLDPEGESDDDAEVTIGYHDRFVTCCFTRQGAEEFIKRERHNLTKPRIWVDHIPHRNVEMRALCLIFGDKR